MSAASNRPASSEPAARPRLLLVEDDPAIARLLRAILEVTGAEIDHVTTGAAALEHVNRQIPDLMLLDLRLPDMHGFDILRHFSGMSEAPATVVITADATLDMAVGAMRDGAVDFIAKPFSPARVLKTVTSALENGRVKRELEVIRRDHGRDSFDGLVGRSAPMLAVYRMIEKVAASKASVFITGESGTGKDVVASAIHAQSTRAGRAFVALNCGAIPKDLMESELFGHVKGAFTGATGDRAGAARRAHGGTLFLDELGEMEINLQSKLLRFIQTGDVQPVGGSETHSVDVRFICATNRDPEAAVARGRLREDLFYRLNVLPLHLPPLRERGDDVILIAQRFLETFSQEEGKSFEDFAPDTVEHLLAHRWPGNVRELQNVIRRIIVLHEGRLVTPDMLPLPVRSPQGTARSPALTAAAGVDLDTEILPLWQVEKAAIESAIVQCGGNVVMAAARLGINPSTIYRKRQSWARGTQAAE